MQKTKRAWTYCRVDAPEDTHSRLNMQKTELLDYAEQMNFKVVGSSEDIGSGLDFERPGLLKVMKAAGAGKFDVLLIKQLARLGRDMIKTIEFFKGLEQLNILVYSTLEGEITSLDAIDI